VNPARNLPPLNMHPAVFFDRDGTLMTEVEYCGDPAKVSVFPGAREALQKLKAAGFKNIIITNQSGIGRGYYTEEQYHAVHAELLRQVGGDLIDGAYFCPAAPEAKSPRRKPYPAMVLEAAREHGIDLARSFFIGDKASDIDCGRNAGVRTILVLTGYGEKVREACKPDHVVADVCEAAELILKLAR
jgi:D-glycero-D-manno-heptose 1,7-bisphosphate phosphatase